MAERVEHLPLPIAERRELPEKEIRRLLDEQIDLLAHNVQQLLQGDGINSHLKIGRFWKMHGPGVVNVLLRRARTKLLQPKTWTLSPLGVIAIFFNYNPHDLGEITVFIFNKDIQPHTISIIKEELLEFAQAVPVPVTKGARITYDDEEFPI